MKQGKGCRYINSARGKLSKRILPQDIFHSTQELQLARVPKERKRSRGVEKIQNDTETISGKAFHFSKWLMLAERRWNMPLWEGVSLGIWHARKRQSDTRHRALYEMGRIGNRYSRNFTAAFLVASGNRTTLRSPLTSFVFVPVSPYSVLALSPPLEHPNDPRNHNSPLGFSQVPRNKYSDSGSN